MSYKLTEKDHEVMDRAQNLSTGGFAAFTAHYFSPINGIPRPDLIGVSPDEWDIDDSEKEYVPWMPLGWQIAVAHDSRPDQTIIGGLGSGKTEGVGAAFCYWCAMQPNFRAMNAAPRGWQAKQMFDAIKSKLIDWDNHDEDPTYISLMIDRIVSRPYPVIFFKNGSTIEFMSAENEGSKIRSWSGDVICVDEAGLLEGLTGGTLDELLVNVGSRVRGISRGRVRLGKIIVMSNADYDPEMWQRFDLGLEDGLPEFYMSILITTYDNPYLTAVQIAAMERRITDPEKRRQMLSAERPMPRGREFPPQLLSMAKDVNLDATMRSGLDEGTLGFVKEEMEKAGIIKWELPASSYNNYVLIGDPGQGTPPNRNSAVAIVVDVTGFPEVPCSLTAFHWIDGRGSYWPFINQMKTYTTVYRPLYTAIDSTGAQKSMNELAFVQAGILAEGLNVSNMKMAYVLALKLVMGKSLMRLPDEVKGIWFQLATWHMPDTKLKQDIASTLFMLGYVLNRLFVIDQDSEIEPDQAKELAGEIFRVQRYSRSRTSRFSDSARRNRRKQRRS